MSADRGAIDHVLDLIRDGTLSVDEAGAVWRHRANGHLIAPRRIDLETRKGYRKVQVGHNRRTIGVYVHRLQWELANGPIPDGLQINHLDKNRANNRLDNLEVCEQSRNTRHRYETGTVHPWAHAIRWRGRDRLTDEQRQQILARRAAGRIYKEIAQEFGVSVSHVQRVCNADP